MNSANETANVKLVDSKTPVKTKKEMMETLEGVDLLFIEEKTTQSKEYIEVAKQMGVMAVGIVSIPIPEEEKNKFRIE